MKRDNLHYTFRSIDGYDKTYNFVISPREPGKSTAAALDKAWKAFKEGYNTAYIRRSTVAITEEYINSIVETIKLFTEEEFKITYKKSDIKNGIVSIYIKDKLFITIISLSKQVGELKSIIIRKLKFIIFDEFIINRKFGEKYNEKEVVKFMELYNSLYRTPMKEENMRVKCYFLGNPYSRANPYFTYFNVDLKQIFPGNIVVGTNFVIEVYEMKPELREWILEHNPTYAFDNSYKEYAFYGRYVNDKNINICQMPQKYKLWGVLYYLDMFIYIHKNDVYNGQEMMFYAYSTNESKPTSKDVYCFDLSDVNGSTFLMTALESAKFETLKIAMGRNKVGYDNAETFNLLQEIFELI